ncbi:MAG: class I SAM-dependent methyltransferase [Peptostreptococcaceae bacterium]|nr:class I SAM-dependent methyltransferase [Peptostreptococcaceae bacterium]
MSNKKIWNYWSSRYERLWMQKYSLSVTREAVLSTIAKYRAEKWKKLLDIGCGTGQLLTDIEQRFGKNISLLGIDYSQGMIDIAEQKSTAARFLLKDVGELLSIGERFDIITCTHSLPYYENQQKAVRDMTTLLEEDGLLILAHGSVNNRYDKIAFTLTKTTTGKAKYLSKREVISLCNPDLVIQDMFVIRVRRWMPTILVSVFRKRRKDADSVD